MTQRSSRLIRLRVKAGIAAGLLVASTLGAKGHSAEPPPDFQTLAAAAFSPETAPHSARAQATMLPVAAATYPIGRDTGPPVERPAHRLALAAFKIDATEVTNEAFAEYLNALAIPVTAPFEAGRASLESLSHESASLLMENLPGDGVYPIIALDDAEARIGFAGGRFVATPGFETHPVTETSWAGARAYCTWRGARLPSEVEWEAAARGPDARLYPWGDAPPDATRVFVSGRTGMTAPVGGRPEGASPVGAQDMSGSLAEWTSSLLRPYPYDADDGRERPDLAGERVTRGGDYIFDAEPGTLTATHRQGFSNAPERGHRHIGFRCAATTG
jgi:iron(II)-dependent oxidoreductase